MQISPRKSPVAGRDSMDIRYFVASPMVDHSLYCPLGNSKCDALTL